MSQAALSSQIKKLEEELEVELFERNKRTVLLTSAGEELLAQVPDFIEHDKYIREKLKERTSGECGTLHVGFVSSASIQVLPQLVRIFEERFPAIRLDLRNWITADQVRALSQGDLDAGILRLPIADPGVKTLFVHQEPFCVLLPSRHPLRSKASLTITDLRGQKQIVYSRSGAPGFHDQVMGILVTGGNSVDVVQEASDMYSICALVAAGLGVAVVPATVGSRKLGNIVVRPLRGTYQKAQLGFAVRASGASARDGKSLSTRRVALTRLEEVCREIFATL